MSASARIEMSPMWLLTDDELILDATADLGGVSFVKSLREYETLVRGPSDVVTRIDHREGWCHRSRRATSLTARSGAVHRKARERDDRATSQRRSAVARATCLGALRSSQEAHGPTLLKRWAATDRARFELARRLPVHTLSRSVLNPAISAKLAARQRVFTSGSRSRSPL